MAVTLPRGRKDLTSILASTGEIPQPPGLSLCLEFSLFSKSANQWSIDQKRPPCLAGPAVSCGEKTRNQGLTDTKVTESRRGLSGARSWGRGWIQERRREGKGWSQAAGSPTPHFPQVGSEADFPKYKKQMMKVRFPTHWRAGAPRQSPQETI